MRSNLGKFLGRFLTSGILLVGLIGLLVVNSLLVGSPLDLAYTPEQQEVLSYYYSRNLAQMAPATNYVQPDGQVIPTILPGRRSRVRAMLRASYEEKDGVTLTVYDLDFQAEYELIHGGDYTVTLEFLFPFPSNLQTLHGVRFLVDEAEPADVQYSTQGIRWLTTLSPEEGHTVTIGYQADGVGSFTYGLYHEHRSDVDVVVSVLGVEGSQVSENALAPSAVETVEGGEVFSWGYEGLIADRDVELTLPRQLNFAQLVAERYEDLHDLSRAAPWLVGLFLVALFALFHLSGVRLRLDGYLLAGCGMALFYPLLTFLSGLVDVIPAAIVGLLLVAGLEMVFLGMAVGWRQTWRGALLLGVFLGLFSMGMLSPWRGLLLTIGGVVLLGAFMAVSARRPPEVEPEAGIEAGLNLEMAEETLPKPLPKPDPEPTGRYCPYCARKVQDGDNYCPGCGRSTSPFYQCVGCGHEQFVPRELDLAHCLHCGEPLARVQVGALC
jgi:hypothetical protein